MKPYFKVLMLAWLSVCCLGFALMASYQHTAGAHSSPGNVPGAVSARLPDGPLAVYFFLHPGCTCSLSSLSELQRVLHSLPDLGKIHLEAIVFSSEEVNADDTRASFSSELPWTIAIDEAGAKAAHFGIKTSGHVLVMGQDEEILFNGGVTASRGHAGANPRSALLTNVLTDSHNSNYPIITPVFGCSIVSQS